MLGHPPASVPTKSFTLRHNRSESRECGIAFLGRCSCGCLRPCTSTGAQDEMVGGDDGEETGGGEGAPDEAFGYGPGDSTPPRFVSALPSPASRHSAVYEMLNVSWNDAGPKLASGRM